MLPTLKALRTLGKFLGLLVFLPYQLPVPVSLKQIDILVSLNTTRVIWVGGGVKDVHNTVN